MSDPDSTAGDFTPAELTAIRRQLTVCMLCLLVVAACHILWLFWVPLLFLPMCLFWFPYSLAKAARVPSPWSFAFAMLIPLASIRAMVSATSKGKQTLRSRGVQVGFLGTLR